MALRHRTLLRHFSRRLMYKDLVVSGLLRRRHSSYHRHVEPPLVIVRFRLLRRVPGILFELRSGKSSHCVPPEIEDSTVCHLFSGRNIVI